MIPGFVPSTWNAMHDWGLAHYGARSVIYPPCILLNPHVIDLDDDVRVDSLCKLEGGQGMRLGRWVHVASFAHLGIGGGTLEVGEGVSIGSGARILSGTALPDSRCLSAASPAHWQHVARLVTRIAPYAFVGAGATVMPGVTIGRRAIVGAGAVVTHDVAPNTIVMGVPARWVRERPCSR